MSFTGAGPLGSFAWGTTTRQALQTQEKDISNKYNLVQQAISKPDAEFSPLPFPHLTSSTKPGLNHILNLSANETSVWPAAVFTANEAENLPADVRGKMQMRKREFSDQPADIVTATNKFRDEALASLQRRHAAIEALPAAQRSVIYKAAEWISAVVVNVGLREGMLYPLIRDQIQGASFYDAAITANDTLRALLRHIRMTIYTDASSVEWYSDISRAQQMWQQGQDAEEKNWIPKLEAYLQNAQLETLRDICQSREHPGIEEPKPATSHDMNYGQQLQQMFQIQYLYITRTGNLQGIPRPRHEAEWACADGYQPAYHPTYDEIDGLKGTAPAPTGKGVQAFKEFPEPKFSTEVPPPSSKELPEVGASLNRVVAHPVAATQAILDEFIKDNTTRRNESVAAIEKALIAKYGSLESKENLDKAHRELIAKDREKSIQEYLKNELHTTDLEGSYYWNEVQLAFRCHGTHWETLSQDITPLGHHYLLIHYDVMFFKSKLDSYRLKVFGCVKNPLVLTMDQIKEMAKGQIFSTPMVMECSGNGRAMMKPRYNAHVPWGLQAFGCYCWTGTPLRVLLDRVGVTDECIDIVFTGYDAGLEHEKEVRYFQKALNVHDPVVDHSWLIWMNNGVDLLPEHGYPLRLMVPAWYGNINIKWLKSIEFIPRAFKGVYQRMYSYTKSTSDNDIAVPSQELRPRAMVAPVGFPDFTTRKRTAIAGQQRFHGKCWVGGGHYRVITLVELSLDAGKSWLPCLVEPRLGVNAWANFSVTLDIPVGVYEVVVRAADNLGNRQGFNMDWNFASMQDDAMQQFTLTVVDSLSVME